MAKKTPTTKQLDWYIADDHFAAESEYGTYTVGEWGNGQAFVNLPGKGHEIVPFDTGKTVAQADYDLRQSEAETTVEGPVIVEESGETP